MRISSRTQPLLNGRTLLLWGAVLFAFLLLSPAVPPSLANQAAKARYLDADNCLKKLRKSPIDRQKVTAWLGCINRYESIYTDYPEDSWAPAGMFKAAQLYFRLYELSPNPIYQIRGEDLLIRIKNKYPESAYSRRATTLQKQTAAAALGTGKIKTITSKKEETRDDDAIDAYREQRVGSQKSSAPAPIVSDLPPIRQEETKDRESSPPKGDTKVTALRFWSNPEYTRIVVNADADRPYSHRLLKKDPAINKPQRLYVDIEQARLGKGVADHTPINDDLLSQARAGQYRPHTVRVVVDIKSFENYKIFSLKDPFRIVIDVWGQGGKEVAAAPGQSPAPSTEQTPDQGDTTVHQVTTDNLKSSDIARQLALGVRKIVIDPGHGGKDPGAPGYFKGVWEKDIVLKLGLALAEKLKQRLNCQVLLTRDKDKKLTLEERTAIANTERADLFISLHCNAARSRKLTGIETYILNLATDEQAIAVAARENATSRKNISDLEYILSDLMKHAKIEESSRLAGDVHGALVSGIKKNYSHIKDLGVKQAPFYVLLGARMPSILIETSFISNKRECKRLMSKKYRDHLCDAITDGIEAYINATNPKQL